VQAKRKLAQRESQVEYIQSFLEDLSIVERPRVAEAPLKMESKQNQKDDLESD
jgi:hypothetical protein